MINLEIDFINENLGDLFSWLENDELIKIVPKGPAGGNPQVFMKLTYKRAKELYEKFDYKNSETYEEFLELRGDRAPTLKVGQFSQTIED